MLYGIEFGCVMANAQRHITHISGHIVDAVQNNLAVRERGEVMVKGGKDLTDEVAGDVISHRE